MIKKLLFLFFFFLGISIISLVFLPSLIMPNKVVLFGGKMMGRWAALCLQIILQTKIIVKGKENIIQNEKFFIVFVIINTHTTTKVYILKIKVNFFY